MRSIPLHTPKVASAQGLKRDAELGFGQKAQPRVMKYSMSFFL